MITKGSPLLALHTDISTSPGYDVKHVNKGDTPHRLKAENLNITPASLWENSNYE